MNQSRKILCHIEAGVATITLNSPHQANALGLQEAAELAGAIMQVVSATAAGGERRVRAVLLTANGDRFCAGGNIAEFVARKHELEGLIAAILDLLHPAIQQLAQLPVPVITAANGPLGGAGIALALCADIVLAADTMKLRGGYTAIGLSPDLGASYYLTRRVGAARAKRILFMNEALDAQQCLALGIVDQVLPAAQLQAAAQSLAAQLAQAATQSLARVKLLCDGAAGRTLQEHLALERESLLASARSADGQEGILAFSEKRAPVFSGS